MTVANKKEESGGGRRFRKLPGNGRFVLFRPDETIEFSKLKYFKVDHKNFSLSEDVAKKVVEKMSSLQYIKLKPTGITDNVQKILLNGLKYLVHHEWKPAAQKLRLSADKPDLKKLIPMSFEEI